MPIAALRVHVFLPEPLDVGTAAIVLWLDAVVPGASGLSYSEVVHLLLLVVCRTALVWKQRRPVFSVSVIGGAMVIHAVVFNSVSLLIMSSTFLAVWTVQLCLNRPLWWLFLGFLTAESGLVAGLVSITANSGRDPLEHVILVGMILLAVAVVALARVNRRVVSSRTEKALEWMALLEAQQEALHHLAAVKERAWFVRGLCDVLGHTPTIIAVQAEGAPLMSEHPPERSRETLCNMVAASRRGVDGVRALMDVLQSGESVPTSLVPESEWVPRRASPGLFPKIMVLAESTGLPVRATLDLSQQAMPPSWVVFILDTVEEAPANAAGHAGFVPVRLSCALTGIGIILNVKSGSGPQGIDPSGAFRTGTGLFRLRKRTTALGATPDARSDDGNWHVSFAVPREPQEP